MVDAETLYAIDEKILNELRELSSGDAVMLLERLKLMYLGVYVKSRE